MLVFWLIAGVLAMIAGFARQDSLGTIFGSFLLGPIGLVFQMIPRKEIYEIPVNPVEMVNLLRDKVRSRKCIYCGRQTDLDEMVCGECADMGLKAVGSKSENYTGRES